MAEHVSSILIVDDEEEFRNILRYILEKEGFKVITAQDGEQALQKICLDAPDEKNISAFARSWTGSSIREQ